MDSDGQTPLAPAGSLVERFDYSRLSHLQIGRYAEYLVKMEFTLYGFDVYGSEVDDRGIDIVLRCGEGTHLDVQVKSLRGSGYIFFPKVNFSPRESLLAAVVLFENGTAPRLYLIPPTVWRDELGGPFVDRRYIGLASPPEWGIRVNSKHSPTLDKFRFERTITKYLS